MDRKQIELLEEQLRQIEDLKKSRDMPKFDSWHTKTTLILKKNFGQKSDEVDAFKLLDGRSGVVVFDDEEMDKMNQSAYVRDLNSARSLLEGIIEFHRDLNEIEKERSEPVSVGTLEALHPIIQKKCSDLYISKNYAEAVEKGFKVVRDRLRSLTKKHETGSEAFGKGGIYIKGASAKNVDKDFQEAVKFLTMSIDYFRNEKSHTSDGKIDDPLRAYEYMSLSSLAMHLLDNAEIRKNKPKPKPTKNKKKPQSKQAGDSQAHKRKMRLTKIQVNALKLLTSLDDRRLLVSESSAGTHILPLGRVKDEKIQNIVNSYDGQEVQANLEELASIGILKTDFNSQGNPIFGLTRPGYDLVKQVKDRAKKDGTIEFEID